MRFDTKIVLKDYDGTDLTYVDIEAKDAEINKPITIKYAFYNVLNTFAPNEIPTAEDKAKSYGLSVKLYQNDEIDLTFDDMAYIKKRAGVVAIPIVYGRICELFERKDEAQAQAQVN